MKRFTMSLVNDLLLCLLLTPVCSLGLVSRLQCCLLWFLTSVSPKLFRTTLIVKTPPMHYITWVALVPRQLQSTLRFWFWLWQLCMAKHQRTSLFPSRSLRSCDQGLLTTRQSRGLEETELLPQWLPDCGKPFLMMFYFCCVIINAEKIKLLGTNII